MRKSCVEQNCVHSISFDSSSNIEVKIEIQYGTTEHSQVPVKTQLKGARNDRLVKDVAIERLTNCRVHCEPVAELNNEGFEEEAHSMT